jgi:hypothetical protein
MSLVMLSLSLTSETWAGIDPLQFITQDSPQVVMDAGKPKLAPQAHGEVYLTQDKYGAQYRLSLGESFPIYTEIGESLLAQGLNLPNIPTYPILVKRGRNGVPTSDAAKKLGDKKLFGQIGKQDKWFPASLQPIAATLREIDPRVRVSGKQVAEWMGQLIVKQVLGDPSPLDQSSKVMFSELHVVSSGPGRHFEGYDPKLAQPLEAYLNTIPKSHLEKLSTLERRQVAEILNEYLTRLEKLSQEDIDKIFGIYFDETQSRRKSKKLFAINYRAELRHRIESARKDVLSFLSHTPLNSSALDELKSQAQVDKPHIHLPPYNKEDVQKAVSGEEAPETRLWRYFFEENATFRARCETLWAQRFKVNPNSAISHLLKEAKERRKIYFVAPTVLPAMENEARLISPQTHLNPRNSKTLIVASPNDKESVEILRVARASGARVLEFDPKHFAHGRSLSYDDAERIVTAAKNLGVDTVAIIEIPGKTPEVEETIVKQGLKLHTIDHHDDNAIRRRASAYSSLEQVAQMLGHDLDPEGKIIEVMDRRFIGGLNELGISKEMALATKFSWVDSKWIENVPFYPSSQGPIYLLMNNERDAKNLKTAISVREWEQPHGILSISNVIHFSGASKICDQIDKNLAGVGPEFAVIYKGGTAANKQFIGIAPASRTLMKTLVLQTIKPIEAAISPEALPRFQADLQSGLETLLRTNQTEAQISKESIAEILNLPEHQRIAALAPVHWEALTEDARAEIYTYAEKLRSSREIIAFAKLAKESRSTDWINILNKWSDYLYANPADDENGQLRSRLKKLKSQIKMACTLKAMEEELKVKWESR